MCDRFSGLRCRPGDLAVIVQDEPECQANLGQIVRVQRESLEFPNEWGFHWLIQPLSSQPSPFLLQSDRSKPGRVVLDAGPRSHYDGWLKPLLDTNEADEMSLIAGVPTPFEGEFRDPVHLRVD